MPSTPTSNRSARSSNYGIDSDMRHRRAMNGSDSCRPSSKDGRGPTVLPVIVNSTGSATRSRLPRTTSTRPTKQSVVVTPKKENGILPKYLNLENDGGTTPNSRRRRRVSGDLK